MEISEEKLLIISLAMCALGLVAIWLCASLSQPATYKELEAFDDGTYTLYEGKVLAVKPMGEAHARLQLATTCTVTGIVFDHSATSLENLTGKVIHVTGSKQTYNGEPEIIVEGITKVLSGDEDVS